MKQLIINADDFGLSSGANRGIIRAWQEGILTSASLMPGGEAFDEAVALAKENPGLQVGLHLTLVQGRGVLPREGIPHLVDESGNFDNDPVHCGMRYFFLKPLRKRLAREIEAQIVKVRETGLPISHVDGHLNIHMHPVVFDILSRLMPRYGISSFRLSCEDLKANLSVDRQRVVGKVAESFIFGRLADACRGRLDTLGITYSDEVKGLYNSGRMTEDYLLATLDTVRDGMTEIYFHPGCRPCATLDRWMPEYRHDDELAALTSPKVREKMARLGIRLRNYRGEEKKYA
ncbi:hopanoid biosynthesis-associated protein HpnK [Geomesophilobacter sediminis]|uniref:Hopanoid biosynthesis-associated protein HpnK n=1 Tax=Geomesophilobacter sediminis TaxID=2798584 RepID=A0A8J7J8H6_9BACT|nr:hopanoid biosynthesis-associated protein HpnK [Geomesophilobacter sediminis]MBJ6725921.1 hopanoid biosynthesis-associated protein HpnK [Geomesophilobacter sediminis]